MSEPTSTPTPVVPPTTETPYVPPSTYVPNQYKDIVIPTTTNCIGMTNQTSKSKLLDDDNTVGDIPTPTITKPIRRTTMAELTQGDLYHLFREHNDIRRDIATGQGELRYDIGQGTNESIKETIKSQNVVDRDVKEASYVNTIATKDASFQNLLATKDGDYKNQEATDKGADRLSNQLFQQYIANQSEVNSAAAALAALTASTNMGFNKTASEIQSAAQTAAAAAALESAKVAAAVALGQSQLERAVVSDGNETRRLINDLRISDLERKLVERNHDIHGFRHEADRWRGHYDQSQFAAINNQMQNFGSQLQETRQGVVNFGSMTGNAGRQTSTNNVV